MSAPKGLDWDWAVRTGGALTATQRAQLLPPIMRLSAGLLAMQMSLAVGRRGTGSLDLETFVMPDSGLAADAVAEACETLSVQMVAHSYRTYLFSVALAGLDGVTFDPEHMFVASMLHDICIETATHGKCFAVAGGLHAHAFMLAHGADDATAVKIAGAIAGHLTAGAAEDLSTPEGFISAGAFCDVVGRRVHHLTPDFVSAADQRYPRTGFKHAIGGRVRPEAKAAPKARIHMLRYPFPLLIKLAPFES